MGIIFRPQQEHLQHGEFDSLNKELDQLKTNLFAVFNFRT